MIAVLYITELPQHALKNSAQCWNYSPVQPRLLSSDINRMFLKSFQMPFPLKINLFFLYLSETILLRNSSSSSSVSLIASG